MELLPLLLTGAVGGLCGAFAMTAFMKAVSGKFSQRVDMVRALGSFFTGRLDNAEMLGRLIHAFAGLGSGLVYVLTMELMGALTFPYPVFLGIAFGFFHGLLVSYALMFVAAERHPVEQYRKATLEEGMLHLVGHLIFGLVVGLVASLAGFF